MPTVIAPSTSATATQAFNQRKVDRNQDGTLWEFANTAATSVTPSYSKDNGATWTATTALSGLTNASLFIDLDDYAHVVWFQSGGVGPNAVTLNEGFTYYMRGTPNAGRTAWTWSAAATVFNSANANYPDVVAHREGTGWAAQVVHSFNAGGVPNLAYYRRVDISTAGVFTVSASLAISGNYSVNAHTYPSIDFNHTGDGKTVAGGTPHLYVGWTAGATGAGLGVRFRKAVYAAGAWMWSAEREIDNTRAVVDNAGWLLCSFDGTRVALAGQITSFAIADVMLYERDAPDATTTARLLISDTGSVAGQPFGLSLGSATYDKDGNVYLLGRDLSGANGTRKLNYRKWTRSTATLGPIVTFDTTGTDTPFISAKRGYSSNSIDWVYTAGTASPYAVTFERLALPPLTPYVPAIML